MSVPITWDELRATLDPLTFTLTTVPRRLARLSSIRGTCRQRLTAQRLRAVAGL